MRILPFVLSGLLASTATAQGFFEATLQSVDVTAGTIRVLGIDIDCTTAAIHTPGGIPVSLAQVNGAPLPGSASNGYVGGTVFVTCELTPFGVSASDVVLTTPETVLIGNVTQNDPGGSLGGRTISVLGVPVRPAVDPRVDPFEALINGLALDVSSVPLGSPGAAVGYFGSDGVFYAHVFEAEQGQALNPAQVTIQRARCKGGTIDARGSFSRPEGTVQLLDQIGRVLGQAAVQIDGTWSIRVRQPACPTTVTARHVQTGALSAPFTPTN